MTVALGGLALALLALSLVSACYVVGAIPVLTWFTDKLLPAAILAIGISWFIPRAMERYRGRRDHLYKTIDTLRDRVQTYQKSAVAYWLTNQTAAGAIVAEAELDFLTRDITSLMRLVAEAGIPDLWGSANSPGVSAVSNLVASATATDRIIKNRKPDPSRVSRINGAATALNVLLLHSRWSVLKKD